MEAAPPPPAPGDLPIRGDASRTLAERLLKVYFQTQDYALTRHHIESYDQFLSQDLPAMLAGKNPLIMLQGKIRDTMDYMYRAEIFIGGMTGKQVYIGTPTVTLKDSEEVRVLYPNEARLRNLTYASSVEADIVIRVTFNKPGEEPRVVMMDPAADPARFGYLARFPLFKIPIMLHSRYCLLHGKPQEFLVEAGECQYDQGGYFIVNGAEKVLITHQEQSFNVLDISLKDDPKISLFASIRCLSPSTRQIKYMAFQFNRIDRLDPDRGTLHVSLPYVRKPVPVFILFRAMGVQSDEDILRMIFPDPESAEAKMLSPLLYDSMVEAHPFLDTFSAVQFIKVFTKGFSEAHVLDVLYNQTFTHVENRPGARLAYLADCVRKILRVKAGIDKETDRDDTRNQRCITSGVLTRMLFEGAYNLWSKAMLLTIDREYKNNEGIYQGDAFLSLFGQGTLSKHFSSTVLNDNIMRGFKGKWRAGTGVGVGEEKSGVLQALSRLSYMDFLSHCRRVVLDFDTGEKNPEPRRLHTSQYGYFCTNETPGGASIGITKNLSILAAISTYTNPATFIEWLLTRGAVMGCDQVTPQTAARATPVYVNAGIVGYTLQPLKLRDALKAMKWTGCLPATVSIGFNIREQRLFVYMDEGRPLRPLIHLGPRGTIPIEALESAKTWRDLVLGRYGPTETRNLYQTGFVDPLKGEEAPPLERYVEALMPYAGVIEYVDPYEANESYVANFPERITPETSHMEIHPSTIVGLMTSMIPYANHNQSPRNQLSCSQSKQGLSVYATNYKNRFDNQVHVLCYPQAPLVRTLYYDYVADGQMGYGNNLILAMGSFTGYNQDDGILMNADTISRGMFRSIFLRSYEFTEDDDPLTKSKTRVGNPAKIPGWTKLKSGMDYSKLDDRGVVRVDSLVDETTVLIGAYMQSPNGDMADASVPAQVWTRGRVESVSIVLNNQGRATVKVRVTQERLPELGDKFCLTPDHEVLTLERGWVGVAEVQPDDHVAQLGANGVLEWILPLEIVSFAHSGEVYEFKDKTGAYSVAVTGDHRMVVANERRQTEILLAKDLFLDERPLTFVDQAGPIAAVYSRQRYLHNPFGASVHCLRVPSQIFLVRRAGSPAAFWTGNSNRHGQKGTIGMLMRGYDMPRRADGLAVDMIMNPHAIPSRMTVAQLLEALMGKAAAEFGAVANATMFMNEGSPVESIGKVLRDELGMEPFGEELMYDGMSGQFIPGQIFVGNVYTMRLKHMPEDKWNARGAGRREQRTHQPTGGRGAQGGLRIGEMERDAILAHGVSDFLHESMMKRSDAYETYLCNGCGMIPIYNEGQGLFLCPTCDGPVRYVGNRPDTFELLTPVKRSTTTFSKVQMPYAMKLLDQELSFFLNMGLRFATEHDLKKFRDVGTEQLSEDQKRALLEAPLPQMVLPETRVPEYVPQAEEPEVSPGDLAALGGRDEEGEAGDAPAANREAPVGEAVEAPAPAPAQPQTLQAAPGPANGLPNLGLTLASATLPPAPEEGGDGLGEEDFEALPGEGMGGSSAAGFGPGFTPATAAGFAAGNRPGSVSVQTNQPVLVVPVNVGAPPPPAEYVPPPGTGSPATFAVDTGEAAMRNQGLVGASAAAGNLKGGGGRSRSNSPRRGGGGGGGSVNVTKQGGGGSDLSSSPNVKVMVAKLG
jgi:DNA-directed RNA polymerase II subunit RPB2